MSVALKAAVRRPFINGIHPQKHNSSEQLKYGTSYKELAAEKLGSETGNGEGGTRYQTWTPRPLLSGRVQGRKVIFKAPGLHQLARRSWSQKEMGQRRDTEAERRREGLGSPSSCQSPIGGPTGQTYPQASRPTGLGNAACRASPSPEGKQAVDLSQQDLGWRCLLKAGTNLHPHGRQMLPEVGVS